MTLNAGTNPLRGGTIEVDGIPVIVPDNTIATLPATAVAWPELFINPTTPNLPGTQSWTATVQHPEFPKLLFIRFMIEG